MDVLKMLGLGGVIAILGYLAKQYNFFRLKPVERAGVKKKESEIKVDDAIISNKRIDDEVRISKAALEWTVQLASQLEKANKMSDKRQQEIDRLHEVMTGMRKDFEKRMSQMESMLEQTQRELNAEKIKNNELIEKINKYLRGG